MKGYAWDYADDVGRSRRGSGQRKTRRERSASWLAEPIEGRAEQDRIYGAYRGARYGDRNDQGYASISEMNPISRELRREYQGLVTRNRRTAAAGGANRRG
jgi:hypothetical protein